MYQSWDDDDTTSEWVNGLGPNGIEAAAAADVRIDSPIRIGKKTIDVTDSLQVWSNGIENNGWLFYPEDSDTWRFHSSDEPTIDFRPKLSVTYIHDEPMTVTDQEGRYEFEHLEPEMYTVAQLTQPGWTQTSPHVNGNTHSVSLVVDADADDINFGNRPIVVGRHLFYNHSAFDGNDASANASDDLAIAPNTTASSSPRFGKSALQSGQTATFSNYSSYSRGINGIMVDIRDIPQPTEISLNDFEFEIGNDSSPDDWEEAPNPMQITVRKEAGVYGSDRVTIVWEDNLIEQTWLRVTAKASSNTGLAVPDVHYWGNAIGDSGDATTHAQVNATDELNVRFNQHNFAAPAPIDDFVDFDRDGKVNATDELIARFNGTSILTSLNLITAPEENAEAPVKSSLKPNAAESANNARSRGLNSIGASRILIEPDDGQISLLQLAKPLGYVSKSLTRRNDISDFQLVDYPRPAQFWWESDDVNDWDVSRLASAAALARP